jgi:hypothetical protein
MRTRHRLNLSFMGGSVVLAVLLGLWADSGGGVPGGTDRAARAQRPQQRDQVGTSAHFQGRERRCHGRSATA